MPDDYNPFMNGKSNFSTPTKGRTASEILALFSPKTTSPSSVRSTIVMQQKANPSVPDCKTRTSLPGVTRLDDLHMSVRKEVIDLDPDTDSDDLAPSPMLSNAALERKSKAEKPAVYPTLAPRHSLRDRSSLTKPKRVSENEIQLSARTLRPQRSTKANNVIIQSDTSVPQKSLASARKPDTARNQIRDSIASVTQRKRDGFYIEKRDYFLPLLPEQNYITKLMENRPKSAQAEVTPYQNLDQQPKGYVMTLSCPSLNLTELLLGSRLR